MNQPIPPDESSPSDQTTDETTPEVEPEAKGPGGEPDGGSGQETPATAGDDRSDTEAPPPTPVPRARGGRALAVFAILIAIAGGAGSAYVYWLTQLASEREDSVRSDVSGDLAKLSRRVEEFGEQLRTAETDRMSVNTRLEDLRKADGGLSDRLDALDSRTARLAKRETEPPAEDWRLAEVDSLLRIANQQATLARSPQAALAALRQADSLLRSMSDPMLQRVRSQIADDMLALQSVPKPDVEGIALRLGSLARRVDALPLKGHREGIANSPGSDEPSGGLARLKDKVVEFFSSIFRVRPTEGPATPLLSPQESFFLRRNLELELQAARIAVLEGETPVYRASIASARRWTEAYFKADDAGVRAFIAALGELEGRQIDVEMPDISGSLEALQAAEAAPMP
jgi:uroporphyrin-3 C-methyltransferase